jgi:hypothetical protein
LLEENNVFQHEKAIVFSMKMFERKKQIKRSRLDQDEVEKKNETMLG